MELRKKVAKEAARLLYSGVAENYKQAKEEAALNLGASMLPSNYEVAVELDYVIELEEGKKRRNYLLEKRRVARKIMKELEDLGPRLIGSVWRGTARKGSDIDITVYATHPDEVARRLKVAGFNVKYGEEVTVTKEGKPKISHHLILGFDEYDAEVVVRHPEEQQVFERCEIYGDLKRGLTLQELRNLLDRDPLRKFIPKRRYK